MDIDIVKKRKAIGINESGMGEKSYNWHQEFLDCNYKTGPVL